MPSQAVPSLRGMSGSREFDDLLHVVAVSALEIRSIARPEWASVGYST